MYTDEQRNIFKYFDGEKEVCGDPLALRRAIFIETGGDPDALAAKVFHAMDEGDTGPFDPGMSMPMKLLEGMKAQDTLIKVVRKVFNMKPFAADGTGAQDGHCLLAWKALARFLKKNNEKAVISPTESLPSAGLPESPTPTTSTSP